MLANQNETYELELEAINWNSIELNLPGWLTSKVSRSLIPGMIGKNLHFTFKVAFNCTSHFGIYLLGSFLCLWMESNKRLWYKHYIN